MLATTAQPFQTGYRIQSIDVLRGLAMLSAQLTGFGWKASIADIFPEVKGYGFNLWVVYLIWTGVVLALYPLCKWYDKYKAGHKEKWWLSYL